jgi:acetyl esterase
MLQTLLLKFFFYVPTWLLKIFFFKKRKIIRGHQFDAQSAALLSVFPKTNLSILLDSEIAETRKLLNEKRKKNKLSLTPLGEVNKINHILPNHQMLLREYQPSKLDEKKAVLYFHGGGYVLSSVDGHDDMVSYMSDNIGVKFYSLDYRLAPENSYPESLDDALEAYAWLLGKGYKPKDISVCGDSAGAHLAASLVHHLSNENMDIPGSQLLIYPMCDPSCSSESYELLSEGYLLTKDNMIWFWDKFRSSEADNINPTFNLFEFDFEKALPPTIIVTGGFDPLCDDGEIYAYLLHKGKHNVKQLHYPTMFHGFASMTRLKAAQTAVEDFLKEYKKIL